MRQGRLSLPRQERLDPDVQGRSSAGLVGFFFLSFIGLAAVAMAVLLPEYAELADLQVRQDALEYQIRCEERLAVYQDRTVRATRNDPVLLGRLLIRMGNYRPVDCEVADIRYTSSDLTVPARILREARNPAGFTAGNDRLILMAHWLNRPVTNRAFFLSGMVFLATAVLFYGRARTCRTTGAINELARMDSNKVPRRTRRPALMTPWRQYSFAIGNERYGKVFIGTGMKKPGAAVSHAYAEA